MTERPILFASLTLITLVLFAVMLACAPSKPIPTINEPVDSALPASEPASEPPAPEPVLPDTAPRDVSALTMFQPRIEGAMFEYEILSVETLMESGVHGFGASPTHIVIRGTPFPGSTRCAWHGLARTLPQRESVLRMMLNLSGDDATPSAEQARVTLTSHVELLAPQFRDAMQTNMDHIVDGGLLTEGRMLACFTDYNVSEYILGAGPIKVTVGYDNLVKTRSYELYRKAHAAGRYGDAALQTPEDYAATETKILSGFETEMTDAFEDRESVVFLAPMGAHSNIAVEVWQAIAQWDIQTKDGVTNAVRYGIEADEAGHSQTLANLKSRISAASKTDAHAGKRIANTSGLKAYYRKIGAYADITPNDDSDETFVPAQPPPPWDCNNGVVVPSPGSNPGLVEDCETLMSLHDTLTGGDVILDWNDRKNIRQWQGITVDVAETNSARVYRLALSGSGLTGTLPAELGDLVGLDGIDLSRNDLTGAIPVELGRLEHLRSLGLGNNALSGPIPDELGQLGDMLSLSLDGNSFNGPVPNVLGNLSELTWLSLHDNDLTGEIPVSLGKLSNLQHLSVHSNRLTGGIPSTLGSLASLNSLRLESNQSTGSVPAELGNLSNLERLLVGDNRLTGAIPSALGNLSNLERLWLDGNRLTGTIPTGLGSLPNLTELMLAENQLTGTIPTSLGGLTNATDLDLSVNSLSGPIPTELGNMSSLESLRLQDNNLTGTLPASLENLTNLEELGVGNNTLSGCIPAKLLRVATNDLANLKLPTCSTS